jgi:hypothetical protein
MTYIEDYVNRLRQIEAAQVVGSLPRPTVSRSEIANLILQKSRAETPVTMPPPKQEEKKAGHGIGSTALHVIDVLSRPLYSVANAADEAFNKENGGSPGDILKAAGRGLKGEDQTSFIDVLQHQYEKDTFNDPEYQRILKQYGTNEAEWYRQTQAKKAQTDPKAIIGGTVADFALDPLNLVGVGEVNRPIASVVRALRGTEKAAELVDAGEELARQAPTSDVPEAPGGPASVSPEQAKAAGNLRFNTNLGTWEDASNPRVFEQGPGAGIPQDLIDQLKNARTTQQEVPRVEGKFGSNRRPPQRNFDATSINSDTGLPKLGNTVKADYTGETAAGLDKSARYANLSDVFNRDLREKDFEGLQKARVINETAQVTDQVAKGNPAAVHLVTNKNINPLSPVARNSVDKAVQETVREITESIADPVKAKAAGKQPRHPVYNAPTQNNLSNKLGNAARNQLKAEGFATGKITNPAAPKFIPAVFDRYMDMLKNAEESLVTRGRTELTDAYYPRGGIKPNSPYLRLSDVLQALPKEIATRTIFGPKATDKVHPSILLKAITGNHSALGRIANRNPDLFKAIQSIDWTPLMVKEYAARTIDAANAAHKTTDDVAKFISDAMGTTNSDATKASIIDEAVKGGKKEFAREMPEAKTSVNDMLDGLRKSIPNPVPNIVDDIIQRGKDKLAAGVFSAGNGQKVAQGPRIEVAKTTVEDIIQMPAKDAGQMMAAADQAADGIFSNVLSWIDPAAGYKTLRPLLLKKY